LSSCAANIIGCTTGHIYFNPPRIYYDDLRERMRTDNEYLARLQPPGLH
jgi:hypothetical protein